MMTHAESAPLMTSKGVSPVTGLLVDAEGHWTNWEPIELGAGSTICPLEGMKIRVWCYEKAIDESLVRTYSYDKESNWTTFVPEGGSKDWMDDPSMCWSAPQDCFVRISAEPQGDCASLLSLSDVASIDIVPAALTPLSDAFRFEIDRVCSRVESLRGPDDLVLVVLSDIHYATGCIWPETARNIQEVSSRIHPDAIVQLGDITDGIAPIQVTRSFVTRVLGDLKACGVPVLGCVGNHDTNYFKGNKDRMTPSQSAALCTGREDLWYHVDFPDRRVRCLFLHSFDQSRVQRYGYADEEVRWLRRTLRRTPRGWKVLVFSHLPLYASIHYWSETLLNEKGVVSALERLNRFRRGAVAAFIHGHSHVDQIYRVGSFPDISIGCAKLEDFTECKPEGSITPTRMMGDASQDLWDVLILKSRERCIELVRFGAGQDRSVICGG